jgi:hypothetical protein
LVIKEREENPATELLMNIIPSRYLPFSTGMGGTKDS